MTETVSRAEYEKLLAQYGQLVEENKQLKEQLNYLVRKLFGKSSEKTDLPEQGQISLFDEDNSVFSQPETTGQQTETVTYTRKKKRTTRQEKIAAEVPVEEVVYTDDQAVCHNCQRELKPMGKSFVREQIRFVPAELHRERVFQTTYKCSYCEQHQEIYDKSSLHQAPVPKPVLAHSLATPSVIAQVAHNKYELYVPGYRQLREFKQMGLTISEPTIINWLNKSVTWLMPLITCLKAELLSQRYLHGDETPCQVLREPNKKASSESFLWLVCSARQNEHQIVYFEYHLSRSMQVVKSIFQDYDGHFLCDGLGSYNYLDERAERSGCWAHLRRKFYESVTDGETRNRGIAQEGLRQINDIFHSYYHPADSTRTKLINQIKAFFNWVRETSLHVLEKSKFGKTLYYALNQEVYLCRLLKDPNIALDNNIAERHIRPAVMGRKNWLFSTSQTGAKTNAAFLTIVETAKANGLNVRRYLEYLLEKLPQLPEFPTKEQLAPYLSWTKSVQETCH